jgi:hypothetical protein
MENLDFSDFFNTKPEADDFVVRMTIISSKIFETSFNPHVALLEQFGIEKRDAFMKLLLNNQVNAESRKAIKSFIDSMIIKISSLPVMSLVLAFEPKTETLKLLSEWFIVNTKKQVLFDIKVDPGLIGGAAIRSRGKYLDFSIKPVFDKHFAQMSAPPLKAQIAPKPVVAKKVLAQ